jgi:hypothetical protein
MTAAPLRAQPSTVASSPEPFPQPVTARVRKLRIGRRRDIHDLLVSCGSVSSEGRERRLDALFGRVDPVALAESATHHRMASALHLALIHREGIDEEVRAQLAARYRRARRAHLAVLNTLGEAQQVLDGSSVRWLTAKGPVLATNIYERPDLRSYADLDLVVDRRQLVEAVGAFEARGYELLDRNWRLIRDLSAGEVHLRRPGGPEVDLHWHLLFDGDLRQVFDVPMDDLLDRRRVVSVGPLRVPTLDPADTVLHLGMHAGLEGGSILVWLMDLDRAVRGTGIDWDEVVTRARQWNVDLLVGVMLQRARLAFDSPVPRDVERMLLRSRLWRGSLWSADRLFPSGSTTTRGNLATLLTRSSGKTIGQTIATASSGVGARARSALRLGSFDVDRSRDDPLDPDSLRYAHGDEADREAFFAFVTSSR